MWLSWPHLHLWIDVVPRGRMQDNLYLEVAHGSLKKCTHFERILQGDLISHPQCDCWPSLQSKDQQLAGLFPDSLSSWSFSTPCLPGWTQHLASSANKHPSMARCYWLDGGARWTNLLPLYQWGELSTHHFSAGKPPTCGYFGHFRGCFFWSKFLLVYFMLGWRVITLPNRIYTFRWIYWTNVCLQRLDVLLYFKYVILNTQSFVPWCETSQESLTSHTDGTEILAVLLPPDEWQDQQQLLNIFRGKDLVDVADGNAECVQRETRVLLNHLDCKLV